MSTETLHEGLKALGVSAENNNQSYRYDHIAPEVLERFPNPTKSEQDLEVRIVMPEWVSRCPLTSQPDFANVYIHYSPKSWCVESKSLKLYGGSYQGDREGIFMEKTCCTILDHLVQLLDPNWMCVNAVFAARGGIPLHPIGCYGDVPEAIRRRTYSFGKVEGL